MPKKPQIKQNLSLDSDSYDSQPASTIEKVSHIPAKVEPDITLKTPPILFKKTQSQLKQLENLLGCPVLSYFKPPNGNIWSQDLYAIMQCLKAIGKTDKLAVFIRSDGGSGMVSLRVIHLLRSYVKKLILLAPAECASAATMLALGCDEIQMGPLSSLSPVDSSLIHQLSPLDKMNNKVSVSLDELWRVVRLWKDADAQPTVENEDKLNQTTMNLERENPYKYLYQYVHPLVFGAVDRYSSLSVRICKEILSYHIKDEQRIDEITQRLNHDYPAHGYPITVREAKKMGLPVKDLSDEVMTLLNELQLTYSELTEEKITDYDRTSYHDNTIYSVVETDNQQITYQHNFDKFYLENEKRYVTFNDLSGWKRTYFDTKSRVKSERMFF